MSWADVAFLALAILSAPVWIPVVILMVLAAVAVVTFPIAIMFGKVRVVVKDSTREQIAGLKKEAGK